MVYFEGLNVPWNKASHAILISWCLFRPFSVNPPKTWVETCQVFCSSSLQPISMFTWDVDCLESKRCCPYNIVKNILKIRVVLLLVLPVYYIHKPWFLCIKRRVLKKYICYVIGVTQITFIINKSVYKSFILKFDNSFNIFIKILYLDHSNP